MKLVLLSLDALFLDDLPLMEGLPFFGEFLAHASGCRRVETVYPALTYPAHTTLVTGADPADHGIGHNQPHHPELEPALRPWYWEAGAVRVPSLFDAVQAAGGSSAAILWPVTGKSKAIRWNFPEVLALPGENQVLKMLRYGTAPWILHMELRHGRERQSIREPYLSDYAALLAQDVIAAHAPTLTAVHWVDLDDMRHHHGVRSREARKAIARLDRRAGEVWRVMRQTRGMEDAVLCLVSDHGQEDVRETVNLTQRLEELGLGGALTVQSNGFGAYLFPRREEDRAHLSQYMAHLQPRLDLLRASRLYGPGELRAMGAVDTVELALEAQPGVAYADALSVDKREKATHGFGPGRRSGQCLLALRGPGIREGAWLDRMAMRDVAPTLASLLGVALPQATGRDWSGQLRRG